MNSSRFSVPDAAQSRLRATIAMIERELARLPRPVAGEATGASPTCLLASFADLVEQLALGPEPEVRPCPVCKRIGMRAATVCGYCWTKLVPPATRDRAVG
jgi:hypothetical protein